MSPSKKITLKSSDGKSFEVDEAVALESQVLKRLIEDVDPDNGIPLPNVTSKILAKVIKYCKKQVEAANSEDDLKLWEANFVGRVDQATLFDLQMAANYLDIKSLFHLTAITVASMIEGKTPEEIRETFNIKNDFTQRKRKSLVTGIYGHGHLMCLLDVCFRFYRQCF